MSFKTFLQSFLSIFVDIQEEKMIFSPQDLTEHYWREIPHCVLDGVFVAAHYHDIDHIIEGYKYRSEREKVYVLSNTLAQLYLSKKGQLSGEDINICPIPMHWSRYLIRGFDHISKLGEMLSKKENVPFRKLLQAHWSRRQSKLHKSDRVKNREHAFSLLGEIREIPDTVLLIDDVISTGSTANACAKILKKAGVKYVYGFFLASNQ